MFEFLRKKKPELKTIEPEVAIAEVQSSSSKYPAEVEAIHKEFFTAADRLAAEAKSIIAEAETKDAKKVFRLEKLGFSQANQVQEIKPILEKAELSREQVELLKYYQREYPLNKFITEDQVRQICFKYNLVCGEVGKYKGFVPEKNLKEIEGFNLKENEQGIYTSNGMFLRGGEIRNSVGYFHIYKKGGKDYQYSFQCNVGKNEWHASDSSNIFGYQHLGNVSFKILSSSLQICAPIKDMDMAGMTIEKGYKMTTIHIPDPVVLHPVKGGYLILTAWGDEAPDPIVVNSINN